MKSLCVFFIVSLLACAALCPRADASEEKEVGRITRITGEVILNREGETASLWPKLTDPIYLHDAIETGEGAFVQIFFDNNSMLELAPGSRIKIDEYFAGERAAEGTSRIHLFFGKIRTILQKLYLERQEFEITTTNAIAGAMGTSFIMDYAPPETRVYVLDGIVEVRNSDEKIRERVLLKANQWTFVAGASAPGAARNMSEDTLQSAVKGFEDADGGDNLSADLLGKIEKSTTGGVDGLPFPSRAGDEARSNALPSQINAIGRDYISPAELGKRPDVKPGPPVSTHKLPVKHPETHLQKKPVPEIIRP